MKLVPNLLDRLFGSDTAHRKGEDYLLSPEQARASVATDIEALLNTRCGHKEEVFADFPLARRSVVNFGIPDFSSMSISSGLDRDKLCASITQSIEQQDRRLRLVSVALDGEQERLGKLRFLITAVLTMSGLSQPVSFSAELDQHARRYVVGRGINR